MRIHLKEKCLSTWKGIFLNGGLLKLVQSVFFKFLRINGTIKILIVSLS